MKKGYEAPQKQDSYQWDKPDEDISPTIGKNNGTTGDGEEVYPLGHKDHVHKEIDDIKGNDGNMKMEIIC